MIISIHDDYPEWSQSMVKPINEMTVAQFSDYREAK